MSHPVSGFTVSSEDALLAYRRVGCGGLSGDVNGKFVGFIRLVCLPVSQNHLSDSRYGISLTDLKPDRIQGFSSF